MLIVQIRTVFANSALVIFFLTLTVCIIAVALEQLNPTVLLAFDTASRHTVTTT
jgi:hypothetical protein